MITGLLQKLRATLAKDRCRLQFRVASLTEAPSDDRTNARNTNPKGWLRNVLVTSVGVTALVLGVRELKWLQSWELSVYDQMLWLRPTEAPDPRILLVTITEDDIRQKKWPLSDGTINQLLAKLQSYQPRVIGLNVYRPEQTNFAAGIKRQDNIISVCAFSSVDTPEIVPPPNFPINNLGFSDLIADDDGVVRRGLLFANSDQDKKCTTSYSFAALLAINFLAIEGIEPDFSDEQNMKLGHTYFKILKTDAGSYKTMDASGYQIMLNYRHPDRLAQEVTVSQVLNDSVNPNWVKDRLVIIGAKTPSVNSGLYTPYNASPTQPARMHAVLIHTQIASQIISAALDGRPLIWYLPEWTEAMWVWIWSLVGGALAWRLRHPLLLVVVGGATLLGLMLICAGLFLQAGWVPVVPPALALVISGITVMAYTTYQTQQQTQVIILQVEKQQEAIEQLNILLKENTGIKDEHHLSPNIELPEKTTGDFLLSGRYKITKVLGSGGFSCTYLAEDTQRPSNPICVVKQLMPARRDTKFLQVARRLFDTEAEILEVLGKHLQIPELLAYFAENNEFYLIEEYIQGHALSEELPPYRNVQNESYVIEMLKGILEVLVFIHEHRVIHRDIKPSNIIRCATDNRLVLIDFGAVKLMQPPNTEQTELATVAIGTRGYAPPEQFAGHPRLSSDIYALGMIGIQAVTGIPPHELQPNPETGTMVWRQWAQVSVELAEILDNMVRYHFSDRYQSAAAVLQDLKRIGE